MPEETQRKNNNRQREGLSWEPPEDRPVYGYTPGAPVPDTTTPQEFFPEAEQKEHEEEPARPHQGHPPQSPWATQQAPPRQGPPQAQRQPPPGWAPQPPQQPSSQRPAGPPLPVPPPAAPPPYPLGPAITPEERKRQLESQRW